MRIAYVLQRILSEAELLEACACDENIDRIRQGDQAVELAERLADHEEEGFWGVGSAEGEEEAGDDGAEDDEDRFSENEEEEEAAAAAAAAAAESGPGKINAEVFNMPLWPEGEEGDEGLPLWPASQVNLGSTITSLLNWQQDHEIGERPFNNLLHIVKQVLPKGSTLPLTRKTCCDLLNIDAPFAHERHWCKPGADGRGCGQHVFEREQGVHLQSKRKELHAAGAKCPKCQVRRNSPIYVVSIYATLQQSSAILCTSAMSES